MNAKDSPGQNMDTFSRIRHSGCVVVLCVLLMILCEGVNQNDGRGADASEAGNPQTITAEQREFFEQKILPVLASKCYSCHSSSSGRRRGGLALDSRNGVFAGGSSGPAVNTNEPAGSVLIHSLKGRDGYKLMPPQAALADSVIGDFETWVRMGAPYSNTSGGGLSSSAGKPASGETRPFDGQSLPTVAPSPASFETRSTPAPLNRIDRPILAKLKSLGIEPAATCSDSVFVRRVYLDVIGTLPTAEEVKGFLEDDNPEKRRVLIDSLLERDEFADYWAVKWCDLLRVKSEFPINLWPKAVQAYHRWVRSCIKQNKPYDRFVREILTASGSNFRMPQVNFFRAVRDKEPETITAAVALTFMGARAENWPQERSSGMAAFFQGIHYKRTGEWKEEIVFVDLLNTSAEVAGGRPTVAAFPDGARVELSPNKDHRQIFADWLIRAENPWFTGNIVNRIWYWLFGIGIVDEPDDIRPDNPPVNPELLTLLQRELVDAQYDLKHIYRLILNSATYQRSCIPPSDRPEAERHFAHYPLRRLDAEVLIDAICQITKTTETYSSLIPEPWTFIPKEQRTICLADASITSPFLELFGRPPRDTGLESERNNTPSAAQKLHLLNSTHIRDKIESRLKTETSTTASQGRASGRRSRGASNSSGASPSLSPENVTDVYLATLSRFPTRDELTVIHRYASEAEAKGKEVLVDLTWALMNTPEFLYRH